MVGSSACRPKFAPGIPDLGHAGPERVLPRDEGGAARRAALLAVVVGESDALPCESVDVGRLVAHHPLVVRADVPVADVVAPEYEDVRLAVGHGYHQASLRR